MAQAHKIVNGDRVRVMKGHYPHLVGRTGLVARVHDDIYTVDFFGKNPVTAFFKRKEIAFVSPIRGPPRKPRQLLPKL